MKIKPAKHRNIKGMKSENERFAADATELCMTDRVFALCEDFISISFQFHYS